MTFWEGMDIAVMCTFGVLTAVCATWALVDWLRGNGGPKS